MDVGRRRKRSSTRRNLLDGSQAGGDEMETTYEIQVQEGDGVWGTVVTYATVETAHKVAAKRREEYARKAATARNEGYRYDIPAVRVVRVTRTIEGDPSRNG